MKPSDLMDAAEVAEHLGVSMSSLRVAMTSPDKFPGLAKRLPPPLRQVGGRWVWARKDVEAVK